MLGYWVALFIRRGTSSLFEFNRVLRGARIIPYLPVASWLVHTPFVEILSRRVGQEKYYYPSDQILSHSLETAVSNASGSFIRVNPVHVLPRSSLDIIHISPSLPPSPDTFLCSRFPFKTTIFSLQTPKYINQQMSLARTPETQSICVHCIQEHLIQTTALLSDSRLHLVWSCIFWCCWTWYGY